MPSPFPGMDPWLEGEATFPNLHERLIISLQDALNAAMPPGYVATSKSRVWVDVELRREPDVAVFDQHSRGDTPAVSGTSLVGLMPVGTELISDPIEETYLEIMSAAGKRLVTAIEVISLSNKKAGERGRETYRQKQEEYRLSQVNLVEIDLLRAGPHVTATPQSALRKVLGEYVYHVSVVTPGRVPSHHAAGIRLSDPLPAIGIPLDTDELAVTVELQPMLDQAYDRGRYSELVDYSQPPEPPLNAEQHAWAAERLRSAGRPIPGGQ